MKYSEISEKQEQTAQWLYHATSLHNLKKIAKTGLRAGTKKRANFPGFEDHIPGKTFFSTSLKASKQWMNYVLAALFGKVADKDLWDIIDPSYITILMTRIPFRKVEKDGRGDGDVRGSVYSTTKTISPNLIQFWHPDKKAWVPLTGENLKTVDCSHRNGKLHTPEDLTEGTRGTLVKLAQRFSAAGFYHVNIIKSAWLVHFTSKTDTASIVRSGFVRGSDLNTRDLKYTSGQKSAKAGMNFAFLASDLDEIKHFENLDLLPEAGIIFRADCIHMKHNTDDFWQAAFIGKDAVRPFFEISKDKNGWKLVSVDGKETVSEERSLADTIKYCTSAQHDLTEGVIQSDIQVPQFFYRGSEMAMRSAFLTKIWRRPDPALPDNLNGLLEQGLTTHVYGLSYNLPFKIGRTYSGMSNWGFGVYFASTIPWAMRYGENITCVTISPNEILAIRADDFAQEIEGTVGAAFRKKLVAKAGDSMRDQAPVIASVVRSMKRGAKALYVETSPGEGQICVFGKSAIYPKFYFEMKKTGEEE